MPNHLTSAELNAATLAVDAAQIREIGRRMAPESFAFLCQRLFKLPLHAVLIDRECFVCSACEDVGATIDLLQILVGPAKIGKPVACWIREKGAGPEQWRPIRVQKRIRAVTVREYHVT